MPKLGKSDEGILRGDVRKMLAPDIYLVQKLIGVPQIFGKGYLGLLLTCQISPPNSKGWGRGIFKYF